MYLLQAGGLERVELNYGRSKIETSTIAIEGEKVVGFGVTNFKPAAQRSLISSSRRLLSEQQNENKMLLPSPIQDSLTTSVGKKCDSAWNLEGHTNLYINGHEIESGCEITANGDQTDSILTVDFGLKSSACTEGFTV